MEHTKPTVKKSKTKAEVSKKLTKSVVFDPGKIAASSLAHDKHIVYQVNISYKHSDSNSFLILKTTTLNSCASSVIMREMKQLHKLRVIFLVDDDDKLDNFLDSVKLLDRPSRSRIFDLIFKVEEHDWLESINDVLRAWCEGVQNERIARAYVRENNLVMITCDLEQVVVEIDRIPALKALSSDQRTKFHISEHGRSIIWDDANIEFDIHSVKYLTNAKYRRTSDLHSLEIYSNAGDAIRNLREAHKLTQEDVSKKSDLSVKQISRIETGNTKLTESAAAKLAHAHGVSLDKYLQVLTSLCNQMQSEQIQKTVFERSRKR